MSTPALVELACALYEDTYGSIGTRLLRVLLERGGSTAPELAAATGLPPSTVLRTLVSLVTNRFVLFWTRGTRTWYFASPQNIYSIMWAGQLLTLFGADAPVLERFITDGPQAHAQAGAAAQELATRPQSILQPLREHEFWPEAELVESLTQKQQRLIASDPGAMGMNENAKRQQIAAGVQTELARIRAAPAGGGSSSSSGANSNGVNGSGDNGSGDTTLAIDYERFLVAARRVELVELARRHIGDVTARVYELVLEASERAVHGLRERRVPSEETSVTTREVADALARSTDNVVEFLASAFPALQGGGATPPPSDARDARDGDADHFSQKRAKLNGGAALPIFTQKFRPQELVNKHLQLLAACPTAHFVQRTGDRMGGEWFVPFERLVLDLKRERFDAVLAQSFGNPAARLVRLIRDFGKLDEKMLGTRALLPALEIRHHMSTLAFFGFADIQELQRPNERSGSAGAPKRSIYLWYHRPQWAYSRLVDVLYTQMTAIMTELRALREKHTTLLAKLTREDVQNDKDQFLTAKEKVELAEFESAERDSLKKLHMIDRHVRIFRDY